MSTYIPPLAALQAFEAAARHLSFKQAATELCVTPSSVSHQIKALETRLGVMLFTRFNREVSLTMAGMHYLAAISPALSDIAHATADISRTQPDVADRTRLTVSANSGFIDCWLSARLPGFMELHPDIELEVHYGEDFADYRNRDADIAIHYSAAGAPSPDAQVLYRGVEFPVCSPDLKIGGQRLTEPSVLSQVKLIHEHDRTGWRRWLRAASILDVDPSKGHVFQNTQTVFNRLAVCDGVGLADDLVAYDALRAGRLVKPFSIVRQSDWTVYLLILNQDREPEGTKQFANWLSNTMATFKDDAKHLRMAVPYPEVRSKGRGAFSH